MPRIELITEVLYGPNDPIHWEYDNLPLRAILNRQNLINLALDDVIEQMRDAIGTQGSLANRLNQSIAQDGSLKTAAIDDALHSIAEHADADGYVRMTEAQSDKLDQIAEEATDFGIEVFTDEDTSVEFDDGRMIIEPSESVEIEIESPNIVRFHLAYPAESAHQHYYNMNPVAANLMTPDYINYKVTSISTPYIEDSLRVYINGVRIWEGTDVYVPGVLVDDPWTAMSFTPDHAAGTFELSTAISDEDVIRIDFDTSYL